MLGNAPPSQTGLFEQAAIESSKLLKAAAAPKHDPAARRLDYGDAGRRRDSSSGSSSSSSSELGTSDSELGKIPPEKRRKVGLAKAVVGVAAPGQKLGHAAGKRPLLSAEQQEAAESAAKRQKPNDGRNGLAGPVQPLAGPNPADLFPEIEDAPRGRPNPADLFPEIEHDPPAAPTGPPSDKELPFDRDNPFLPSSHAAQQYVLGGRADPPVQHRIPPGMGGTAVSAKPPRLQKFESVEQILNTTTFKTNQNKDKSPSGEDLPEDGMGGDGEMGPRSCPICYEDDHLPEDMIITRCGHQFCRQCIDRLLGTKTGGRTHH